MKGKGLIQFFAIALILVCVYQLSFNFITRNVESRAAEYASVNVLGSKTIDEINASNAPQSTKDSLAVLYKKETQKYLDSVSNENVYNLGIAHFTYQECKSQELALGLDLQGGMNVVLQVSLEDLVRSLSDYSNDPVFNQAIDDASKALLVSNNKDFVTLFGEAYTKLAPNGRLAAIFATKGNLDKITTNSTNDEVLAFIKKEADGAFDRTFNIISARINQFGVAAPSITSQPTNGRIVVELPGVDNPARVRNLLQATAKLEFWETYKNGEIYTFLDQANKKLAERLTPTDSTSTDTTTSAGTNLLTSSTDSTKADTSALLGTTAKDSTSAADSTANANAKNNPLFDILIPNVYQTTDGKYDFVDNAVCGLVQGKDTARVREMLSMDFVRAILPRDVKFLLSAKPSEQNKKFYELYSIKMQPNSDAAPLEGDAVISAKADIDQNQKPEVSMNMSVEGGKIWAKLTGRNVKRNVAIVLDDRVYSAPNVIQEITGGRSSISGSFTIDDTKDLANILQAGKLPAPAKIIAEDIVGPSLGKESIDAGIRSIIIAFLGILAFMVLYYSTSGIVANIALLFNLFFIIGVLTSLNATLTLPGIAGLVLTMGMAVDANVLIHERIKEELRKGAGLMKAINDGHTKSYSAVFDTHLTTLITGIILAYFGLGPVLGYAVTLNWGIIMTLFSAVFLAHLIMNWWVNRGWKMDFTTKLSRNNFSNMNIQFVNKRKYAYMFSGTLAVIGLISIFTRGFDYGVDFTGGRSYTVRFDQAVNTTPLRDDLNAVFGIAPVIKTYGSDNQVKITTGYMADKNTSKDDSTVSETLYKGLSKYLPQGTDYSTFNSKYLISSSVVGPSISSDTRKHAIQAIIFSLLGIFLYIFVRFRKWQYGVGAIIALAHDVLMVMGFYSLLKGIMPFSLEVDETFVAAALTVMGYSVNDTVIVFDRIREYLREHPAQDMKKVINDAINQTLNRTIITSLTVLLVLVILFIFGGEVIRGFSFALIMGIAFGTYSSIFVATPIVIDLATKKSGIARLNSLDEKKPGAIKA